MKSRSFVKQLYILIFGASTKILSDFLLLSRHEDIFMPPKVIVVKVGHNNEVIKAAKLCDDSLQSRVY